MCFQFLKHDQLFAIEYLRKNTENLAESSGNETDVDYSKRSMLDKILIKNVTEVFDPKRFI